MDPNDHSETSSHGHKGNAGKAYRADIKALIDAGNMRGAMAKEIKDVRRVAALSGDRTKYNVAIKEMLVYAKCIKMLDK
ncbi:hypothetical protein [Acinetobacter sp. ABJ_C5_2]|uniref:hypothetical protein n=1 Tax=Acinetobacter sp. ABJ_C5_2 TaxID=3376992 RepID=UPI0037CBBCA9